MKKILTLLAFCIFAAFTGTATETLLEEFIFQPEKKNFRFWTAKTMDATVTVKNGVAEIEIKANKSEKPNLYNAQFVVPYNKGFKADVKYRLEMTLKSSVDLKVAVNVSLSQKPWTSLRGKTVQLKAGVPTDTAVNFSSATEITDSYRAMIAVGLAPEGSTVEVSNVKLFEEK